MFLPPPYPHASSLFLTAFRSVPTLFYMMTKAIGITHTCIQGLYGVSSDGVGSVHDGVSLLS